MRVAKKFTPEVLIEFPRRGPAVPSPDGTRALFTVSTHTIGGETRKEAKVMELSSGESRVLVEDSRAYDFAWLTAESVVYLETGEKGETLLKVAPLDERPYMAATLPGPVRCLKVKALEDGSFGLAVVGRVGKEGELFNEQAAPKKSSARVYSDFNVRFWDTYITPEKFTIWYSQLVQTSSQWTLAGPLHNLLPKSSILEAPSGMYDAGFASAANAFDLGTHGIVFTAQDPTNKSPLWKLCTRVYYSRLDSWSADEAVAPVEIRTHRDSSKGVCSHPRLSPNGRCVAFLKQSTERMQDTRLYVASGEIAWNVLGKTAQEWDLVPQDFEFYDDGRAVLLTAQDHGCVTLHKLQLRIEAVPELLFKNGSVSGYWALPGKEKVLVTSSTFVESSLFQILDVKSKEVEVVSSGSHDGAKLGLAPEQIAEIYFPGEDDYLVQAWVVRPMDFDESKKYPLCLLVHGGPEAAWNNQWNTRWNAAAWAEQGYIVVTPNVTGSVGFGLEHTERIYGEWGGLPYKDLAKCMEYLQDMPNLDLENAVAAGGSYGGYMMLWMMGHSLSRKFKAMVCHDGVFHLPTMLLECDEGFGTEDFHGPPYLWKNLAQLDKWNPAKPELLKKWKTPLLVIHSDLDYRVPVTEGLSAFAACQAMGVKSRFVNFPDENHFVLKEENSLRWHEEVFGWINRFSGVSG